MNIEIKYLKRGYARVTQMSAIDLSNKRISKEIKFIDEHMESHEEEATGIESVSHRLLFHINLDK